MVVNLSFRILAPGNQEVIRAYQNNLKTAMCFNAASAFGYYDETNEDFTYNNFTNNINKSTVHICLFTVISKDTYE
jgi:hypothetical protein